MIWWSSEFSVPSSRLYYICVLMMNSPDCEVVHRCTQFIFGHFVGFPIVLRDITVFKISYVGYGL